VTGVEPVKVEIDESNYVPGSIAMGILRRSKIARIFLERVGIFLDAPPPPPPPKKIEVTL